MPGKIDPTAAKKRPAMVRPGEALKHWSFVPFVEFRARNGKQYSSALELLAELAIEERWFFGAHPNPRNAYPILDSHLTYTFFKLKQEKRVLEFKAGSVGWGPSTPGWSTAYTTQSMRYLPTMIGHNLHGNSMTSACPEKAPRAKS
jgi:hypothetical protein